DYFNARVTYTSPNREWLVSLAGTNVTDEFYWLQLGSDYGTNPAVLNPPRIGVPSPQRMWNVSLRKNFWLEPVEASELVLERIGRLVLTAMPEAASPPLGQPDLDRMLGVREEDLLVPLREVLVRQTRRDLVVDAERALVEVGRADRAPDAVDGHHFLVQQRSLILEDADAALEELAEVAVRRVLHQRHVRRRGGRNHDPHVDPARDGSAEGLDRVLAGQKVGILDPDAPSRHADDEVIQDVHRRRRGAGRLHAGEVQRDVARGLECGKHPLADEQLAGLLDPVLAEYALHAVHGGTAQADRDVPVAARVLRLTQPRVLHAVSADE